ncbi:organic cation transporter protein-like [Mytilus edulis]|uniref:organic cation transporter protein-like n=1 Tax=Mytilus edulis TaxID=6550 RepID=UPI0039F11E70
MDADRVLQSLGNYGRFQILVFLCLCFIYMRGAWPVLGSIFLGGVPDYSCKKLADVNKTVTYGACDVTVSIDGQNTTESCPNGWRYGDEFEETIVTQWDLVCDRDYLNELSTTIYMVGNTIGATFLTPLSDKFGRKKTILTLLWIQAAIGISAAFANTYSLFTTLRFFVGMLNMPIALSTYVMVTEFFPSNFRSYPSVAVNCSWSIGIMVLATFGYFLRDWQTLQLVITIPNLLTIFFYWFIPESLPWLIAKKKYKEAEKVTKWASKINGIPFPKHLFEEAEKESEDTSEKELHSSEVLVESDHKQAYTFLDLFRTPVIRRYTIITFYLWFANSISYFGILFATPTLHGNQFLNLGISGAVEIPAQIVCVIAINLLGRRKPLIFFLFLCGIMNIVTIFIPETTDDGTDLKPLLITLAMIGKFGITGSYSVTYLYGSEIFPTVIRNHAVGIASLFENVGGIVAPFIVYGATSLKELPLVVFGVLTIVGGILIFFLPETHKRPLPETIEEVEKMTKEVVYDKTIYHQAMSTQLSGKGEQNTRL